MNRTKIPSFGIEYYENPTNEKGCEFYYNIVDYKIYRKEFLKITKLLFREIYDREIEDILQNINDDIEYSTEQLDEMLLDDFSNPKYSSFTLSKEDMYKLVSYYRKYNIEMLLSIN